MSASGLAAVQPVSTAENRDALAPGRAMARPIPFKGFDSYLEADSETFFGRDREKRIVASNLIASRLTLLHADSGVGKTSLLRAGVASDFLAKARRELDEGRMPRFVPVVFDAWENKDPVAALMKSVSDAFALLGLRAEKAAGEEADVSLSFVRAVNRWTKDLDGSLLIILDQFEQYFERHAAKDQGGGFARVFPEAVSDLGLRVNFLISIREEWLGRMDFFKGKLPCLFDNRLEIRRLDGRAARAAIEGPVKHYNQEAAANGGGAFELGEGLVDAVLRDVERGHIASELAGKGGAEARLNGEGEYEAPYLQLVMRRLWEKEVELQSVSLRTETLYEVLGGPKEIVLRHLNSVMSDLTQRQQRVAAAVFPYLVTPSGTKVAYSALDLKDRASPNDAAIPLDEYGNLLRNLADRKILRTTEHGYEVYHDILARPVLAWRQDYLRERESKKRNLASEAVYHLRHGDCERAALLARQAFLFNRDVPEALAQVDAALREVLSANPFTYLWYRNEKFDFPVIAFSAHGKWLAAGGKDGYVYLWDVVHRRPRWKLRPHWEGSEVWSVAFSPDERWLATAGRDKTLKLLDLDVLARVLPDGEDLDVPWVYLQAATLRDPHETDFASLAFRPGEKRTLASGSIDGFFRFWDVGDVSSCNMLREWQGHTGRVWSVAFSPDGRRFASAGSDGVVRIWDPDRPEMWIATLEGYGGETTSVTFAPGGHHLAFGCENGAVWVWTKCRDRDWNQAEARFLGEHPGIVRSVAFSPDGRILASAGDDETVREWDPEGPAGAPALGVLPHFYGVSSIAFRPQSPQTLISSCWDRTLRAWDVYPAEPRVFKGHKGPVQSVAFGEGNAVASGSWDGTVRLWNAHRPGISRTLVEHGREVYAVAFSPCSSGQGELLASGSLDGLVRVWDLSQGNWGNHPTREWHHGGGVSAVAFGANGAILASGSHDGSIRIWDPRPGGGFLVEFRHGGQAVTSVAWSGDGKLLASGSDDTLVKLWSVDPSRAPSWLATLDHHAARVWSVAFSPDGRLLASGSDDRSVRIWSVDAPSQPEEKWVLEGHEFWVGSVAFSPNGKLLATGGHDRTIRLWNLAKLMDPDELNDDPLILRSDQQSVTSVAFSPDGKLLASGSTDHTLRVWTLDLEDLANRVCSKVSRNLSWEEWEKSVGVGVKYQCICPHLPRGEGVPEEA